MGFWGGSFLFALLAAGLGAAVTFKSKPGHQRSAAGGGCWWGEGGRTAARASAHPAPSPPRSMHHILCGTAVFCCWLM